jgi:hypothetical protein
MGNDLFGLFKKFFSQNFYSLPLMFGSNLKRREVIKCLVAIFGGYWTGICRLGKKIASRKIWHVLNLREIFQLPIFLPSLRISAEQPPNASARPLITSRLFRLLPNIIGNEFCVIFEQPNTFRDFLGNGNSISSKRF